MKITARKLNQRRGSLPKEGFTLVELLVVIAIIAILAAVVVLILNPIELQRKARDTTRLSDIANLEQAINITAQESTASGNAVLCANGSTPCSEDSYPVGNSTRKTDGSGWVKVNLSGQKNVTLPTLPTDPLNNSTNKYSYSSDGKGWEIDTVLESDQNKDKMQNDGGNDPNKYERGSDLSLI